MNKSTLKTLGLCLVVGFVGGLIAIGLMGGKSFGGTVENYPVWFYNGLKAGNGSTAPWQISQAGNMSTTGTFSVSGSGTLTVGSAGTAITSLNAGTCYILAYSATIVSSTTVAVDCQANPLVYGTTTRITALSGITSSSIVTATLSTSTAGLTSGGLDIVGASASTTNGVIQLYIANTTGGTYTWSITANASGTVNYISTR